MQSFGEHGRELITPEVGLRLLEMLGKLGSEMEHSAQATTLQQQLLKHTVFKVCEAMVHSVHLAALLMVALACFHAALHLLCCCSVSCNLECITQGSCIMSVVSSSSACPALHAHTFPPVQHPR